MYRVSKTHSQTKINTSLNLPSNSLYETEDELLHRALNSIDAFDKAEDVSYESSLTAIEVLKEQAFNFRSGFPVNLRHLFWSRLLMVHKVPKDILFENFVKNPVFDEPNQDVINADVNRTRAYIAHFRDRTSRYEMEILLTYYCKNKKIQYKQGMNEILAPFYCFKSSEVNLFQIYNMYSVFIDRFLPSMFNTPDFVRLQCSFVLFKHLLLYHHPKLANHLEMNGIVPELYVTPWFLTLFSSKNSLLHSFCLWDFYISYGFDKFYLFIGLAFLMANSELIMNTEVVRIPELINSFNFYNYESITKVWDLAMELYNQTPKSFAKQLDNIEKNPIESFTILNELEQDPFLHITPEEIISSQYQTNHKFSEPLSTTWKFIFLDFRPTIEYFSGRLPTAHRFDIQTDWESDVTSFFNSLNEPFETFQAQRMSFFDNGISISEIDSDLLNSIDSVKSIPLSPEIIKARRMRLSNIKFGQQKLKVLEPTSTMKFEKFSYDKSESKSFKQFVFDIKPNKAVQYHFCMIFNSSDISMNYRIAGTIIRNLNMRWMTTVKGNFEACHQLVDEYFLELIDHDRQHCLACKFQQQRNQNINLSHMRNNSVNNSFYDSKNSKIPISNCNNHDTVHLKSMVESLKKLKNPIALNFMRTLDQHNPFKQEPNFQRTNSEISYSSTYTPSPVDTDKFPHSYLFGYFLWNTWIGTPEAEYINCFNCEIDKMLVPIDPQNPFVRFRSDKNKETDGAQIDISSRILGLQKLHHHMYSSYELDRFNYQQLYNSNYSNTSKGITSYKVPYSLTMEMGEFDALPGRLVLLPEHIILTTEPFAANSKDIEQLKSFNFLDIAKLAKYTLSHTSSGKIDSYISSSQFTSTCSETDIGSMKPEIKVLNNDIFVKVLGIFSITHLAKITSTKNSPSKRYFYFSNSGFSKPWIKLNFKNKAISDESTAKINSLVMAWKERASQI